MTVTTMVPLIKLPISWNYHNQCFAFRLKRSYFYNAQNGPKITSRRSVLVEIWSPQCLYMLSQSLDDLGTTRGECLGRTRWSSLLDWTTYLYYFYKWLYTTSPRSHVLLECSTITWPCHVIRLLEFLCYLYLVFIVWLDICGQVFERVGNLFLLRALITVYRLNQLSIDNYLSFLRTKKSLYMVKLSLFLVQDNTIYRTIGSSMWWFVLVHRPSQFCI